jgi:cysteine desulfuration protein SufE
LPRISAQCRIRSGCSCCWSSPRNCRRCPAVEVDSDGTVHLFFDAPREAPTTRGFAGILHAGLDGLDADQVLSTPGEFPSRLGLQDLVSPLRLRGMDAMLARIKRRVREQRN